MTKCPHCGATVLSSATPAVGGEPTIAMVAAAQKAIMAHLFFDGGAAVAFGFANCAVNAALAAQGDKND